MIALRAISRAQRAPTAALSLAARRAYSDNHGSVARSREFSKKEKAHEDMFAQQHEKEQLRKIREQIENKKKELEALEQQHDEVKEKTN